MQLATGSDYNMYMYLYGGFVDVHTRHCTLEYGHVFDMSLFSTYREQHSSTNVLTTAASKQVTVYAYGVSTLSIL